jgi:hypothetical protein
MGNPPPPSPSRAPARLVRELAPFVLLACACGAAVRQPPPEPSVAQAPPPAAAPPTSSADGPASFVALAERAASVAPGMREVARKASANAGDPVELVKADARDTCVRAAFEAASPVSARLVDREGRVLASVPAATASGVLGERGPVCVRKGDVVKGVADGAGVPVRWMAWEAP